MHSLVCLRTPPRRSQEGWYQILFRNPDGQAAIGYVSADYLTVTGS